MIDGQTALFGFIAHPAKHSRSPRMHNLSFDYWGLNARYLAFDVAPDQLAGTLAGIRSMGIAGVNLSMPVQANRGTPVRWTDSAGPTNSSR